MSACANCVALKTDSKLWMEVMATGAVTSVLSGACPVEPWKQDVTHARRKEKKKKPNTSTSKPACTVIRIYWSQHCQERYMICRGLWIRSRDFHQTRRCRAETNGLVCGCVYVHSYVTVRREVGGGGRLDCTRWKGEGERVLIIELRCLVWVTILSRLVGNQIIIRNDPHFMLTGFSLSGGMCKRSSEGTHICMYNEVIL